MRLTLWTDYAFRTLIYVAMKGDELSTIADIADSFGISKSHLMKIVNGLEQRGYLETVRGRRGGIRLKRMPADIRVGAVVRDTEEELAVIGCLSESNFCSIERCCVLKGVFHEATQAFLRVLDEYTLADLLLPRSKLLLTLGLKRSQAAEKSQ
jgi:Rrf2 family transcriptional regulator, nitric oxide-sensitive transcriptional repressor